MVAWTVEVENVSISIVYERRESLRSPSAVAHRRKVARRVLETGEREELSPMTPFERKIVHDAVAAVEGVRSESEGVEPSRRVVVLIG